VFGNHVIILQKRCILGSIINIVLNICLEWLSSYSSYL